MERWAVKSAGTIDSCKKEVNLWSRGESNSQPSKRKTFKKEVERPTLVLRMYHSWAGSRIRKVRLVRCADWEFWANAEYKAWANMGLGVFCCLWRARESRLASRECRWHGLAFSPQRTQRIRKLQKSKILIARWIELATFKKEDLQKGNWAPDPRTKDVPQLSWVPDTEGPTGPLCGLEILRQHSI